MVFINNQRKNKERKGNNNGFRVFFAASFSLLVPICIGFLFYFFFSKAIYSLQKFLYQKPGELLIGGDFIMISAIPLILSLTCIFSFFLLEKVTRRFPAFDKYISVEGAMKLDEKKVIKIAGKLKRFAVILIPFAFLFICFGFNEYISLGKNYLAASSKSFFNNREEYNYSDIKITKERWENGATYDWIYSFSFSGNKRIGNIVNDAKIIKIIQNKQRELGLTASEIEEYKPRKKTSPIAQAVSLLLFGSTYFFIAWFFSRLRRKNA